MAKPDSKSDKTSKKPGRSAGTKPTNVLESSPELRNTVAAIEKQFGEGAIMPLGSDKAVAIEGISTGSLSLDIALGGQGLPRGRVIEVFGPESSGKTTLALHVIAEAQKAGGIAAFIDAEHALDPSWAKKLGVDLETLLVSQPSYGEEAMHITEMLIKSQRRRRDRHRLGRRPGAEEGARRRHRRFARRPAGPADEPVAPQAHRRDRQEPDHASIFINQIREKIGVMFGSPETTPGGRALKFYASCRIDVRRIGQFKEGEEVMGQRVRAKVVKNKVAPPFRVAEFDMMHTDGISFEGDVLDMGLEQKIVSRTGAWFRYGDLQLGQGKEKARQYLKENPKLAQELKDKIMATGGGKVAKLAGSTNSDDDEDALADE